MIYFFSYLPYIFISLRYESLTLFSKICSCFICNLAMCLGVQLIGIFEGQGIGINFSNLNEGHSPDDPFSLLQIIIVMFMNNIVHIFLTYYFENIMPGDYGVPKPWYFLFWSSSSSHYPDRHTTVNDRNSETDKLRIFTR